MKKLCKKVKYCVMNDPLTSKNTLCKITMGLTKYYIIAKSVILNYQC